MQLTPMSCAWNLMVSQLSSTKFIKKREENIVPFLLNKEIVPSALQANNLRPHSQGAHAIAFTEP